MHDKNRISEIVRAGYLKNLTGKQIARKLNAEGLTTKRGVRFAQHTVSDYALRVLGLRRVVQQNSKMAMDRQIAMPVADLENRISSQVKSAAQSLSRMDTTPRLDQEKIDTMLAVATSDLRSDLKSKLFLRILKDGAL